MTVAAELTFLAASLLGWAPMIILQAVFLGPTTAAVVGSALTVWVWWIFQPNLDISGIELPREKAPALFEALDELRQKLDAPPIHRVMLCEDLNAAAHLSGGLLSLVGGQRTLLLGVPLLKLLSKDEATAVIAHELGHFSRHHGRLGHWVYNVRAKWRVYLDGDERRDSGLDRLRRWIASAFLPRFMRMSASRSRACEFEADALAVRATGSGHLAQALIKLDIAGSLMRHGLRRKLNELQAESPHAPAAFWDLVADFVRDTAPDKLQAALDEARSLPRRVHDTHPSLDARIEAIGASLNLPDWTPADCAGQQLLGADWPTQLNAANARWCEQKAPAWRLRHLRLRALQARRLADAAGDDAVELAHLQSEDEIKASDDTLQALERHARTHAADALAQYGLGLALLNRARPEGIAQVRSAIKLDRRLAVPGYEAILSHVHLHGTEDEIHEFSKRRDLAAEKQGLLRKGFWRHLMDVPLTPLQPWAAQLLSEVLREEKALDGCWVARTRMSSETGEIYDINLLIARVHHAKLEADDLDEDALSARYATYLAALCPPNELLRLSVYFDTEPINPRLLARFMDVPGCELHKPTGTINANMIKIDSL
ncbi:MULTISPECIES: M48 family metallopeptidase [unclassified Variovorax]|uniref:M48 family metallopeptidase n=1 Tax=unclassified Variovorax TaxID=663243 RepID=UPI003F452FB8